MEWMYFWSKFAVLLSDYLLLQRKRFLYKDYSSREFPVEIAVRRKENAPFQERRNMVSFSSGNCGRLKYASVLP
ncbi:MAG: hypothetical protein MW690_000763 [Methanophagales archaeon]|nr:hypothetical protein [Methanophagales archaeon]MCU4139873.1 hypothetical protein [Methanophagales archaeon]